MHWILFFALLVGAAVGAIALHAVGGAVGAWIGGVAGLVAVAWIARRWYGPVDILAAALGLLLCLPGFWLGFYLTTRLVGGALLPEEFLDIRMIGGLLGGYLGAVGPGQFLRWREANRKDNSH